MRSSQPISESGSKHHDAGATTVVFIAFALCYCGQKPQWNHIAAFLCILGAAAITFLPGK